jgi:plastocyanin
MRTLAVAITAVLIGGLSATGCGNSSGGSTGASAAPVQLSGSVNDHGTRDLIKDGGTVKLALQANDFYFSPTFIKVTPGASVTVELKNEGKTEHTLTIPSLGIDQDLPAGQSATVQVQVPTAGSLQFHCRLHESMGMQGAFVSGAAVTASTRTPTSSTVRSGY